MNIFGVDIESAAQDLIYIDQDLALEELWNRILINRVLQVLEHKKCFKLRSLYSHNLPSKQIDQDTSQSHKLWHLLLS